MKRRSPACCLILYRNIITHDTLGGLLYKRGLF